MSETDLKKLLKQVKKRLNRISVAIMNRAQENLIKDGGFVTGYLMRSARIESFSDSEVTVLFDAPYAVKHEFGGEPEDVPVSSLFRWAKKKFHVKDEEAWSIAYAVRKNIMEEGTDPHPFLRPAMNWAKARIKAGRL